MAVQNYLTNYTPAEDQSGIPEEWAIRGHGVRKAYLQSTVAVTNGDSIGSTYCLFKNVPADVILSKLDLEADAIAGLTSVSIGLYDSVTGAAIAAGCYMNNVDIHAGSTKASPIDGMQALTHENTLQQLYLLASKTLNTKAGNYDVVMTINAAATASGSVTARGELIPAG